jgi:hypothetical protein
MYVYLGMHVDIPGSRSRNYFVAMYPFPRRELCGNVAQSDIDSLFTKGAIQEYGLFSLMLMICTRVARFFFVQNTKTGKIYQITIQ